MVQTLTGAAAVVNKAVFSFDSPSLVSKPWVLGIISVQQCWSKAQLYGEQNLTGVAAVTSKAFFSLGCQAALV